MTDYDGTVIDSDVLYKSEAATYALTSANAVLTIDGTVYDGSATPVALATSKLTVTVGANQRLTIKVTP